MSEEFKFTVTTAKKNEILDITRQVQDIVSKSKVEDGAALVYTTHATCAIIINENYDPNICTDLSNLLSSLIPEGKWLHDRIDDNAAAHLKASIIGPSEMIPVKNNKLQLGRWQDCMLCDFDGPKEREVIVKILK